MENVIKRAINSINQLLESLEEWELREQEDELTKTRDILNRLLESDSLKKDWTRLFCRELNRLMNCDGSLSEEFWVKLHDDIHYLLEGSYDEYDRGADIKKDRFLRRMEFESKLEQRELRFQKTCRESKSLNQIFSEHEIFFKEYLLKCISFHSKIQVPGIIEDLNNFLSNNCGVSFTKESRKYLKYIEIPLDCLNRLLEDIHSEFFEYVNSQTMVNNKLNNFLPSLESQFNESHSQEIFENVLQYERWLVILGDPGSGKTTLLRWITHIFAQTIYRGDQEVIFNSGCRTTIRVPILIRMGEFVTWLDQHKNRTLIDYIGKHTWFSKPYISDDSENVFQELIYHGYALILLDGLDEVPDVRRRGEIVDLVKKFIEEHVRAPDYVSAFDDRIFTLSIFPEVLFETQPALKSGGNQIIIMSRRVGYQLYPLIGPFIRHHSLLLIDSIEAKTFVNNWMIQVEKSVDEILLNEGIKINEKTMENISKRRFQTIETMFENRSKLLFSNPSLLALICTSIFRSPDEFPSESRVKVYNHTIQLALSSWKSHEPNISEELLTTFLVNLAVYLHLESSSGLIDAYDMKQLCCSTLKRLNLINDRKKLLEYADKLILSLESNAYIVAELGLQVFGFQHLSFQEYFVAQSFVQNSSLEIVSECMLTFSINPRFRESLRLALGRISWERSLNDYDQLCHLLVSSTKNYIIPIGVLLLFDAFDDIQRLPSNFVIFTALDSFFKYPFDATAPTYLIKNLLKLNEDIIKEWMQMHLWEDKHLIIFCQCLLQASYQFHDAHQVNSNFILTVIYKQICSLNNISTLGEFIIDQNFRKIMKTENAPSDIFNFDLSSHFLSHNISTSDIHPLILSVIVAVCGGMSFEEEEWMMEIHFSLKQIHRQSSILSSIIEYFSNINESHSTKIEVLIKQYENILEKTSQTDVSVEIVDTFIALICLQGLSKPLIYHKYDGYQALPLALNRLKQTWFYFKKPFHRAPVKYIDMDKSSITSQVELIINAFFSQSIQSNEERLAFSLACAAALNKLSVAWSSELFASDDFPNDLGRYLVCQPEFGHSRSKNKITKTSYPIQMFQHQSYFLLIAVPQSLQRLYYQMILDPVNNTNSFLSVVLLSECLLLLEDSDGIDPNFHSVLSMLQTQFKEHTLENYASALKKSNPNFQSNDWEILINMERQRISDAKNIFETTNKDLRLFTASISLARLFQARYHSHQKKVHLSAIDSEEVHLAIMNILNPILQIIALSIILNMKNPCVIHEEQRYKLLVIMINLLQSLLPHLSLLMATLLFVRCYVVHEVFPIHFQQMSYIIGEKLKRTVVQDDQEAACIALKQLNNFDLSHCLLEFEKRTMNSSEFLHLNSTVFFRYFTQTTSFEKSNTILLSALYLIELAFDAQILRIYTNTNYKSKIPFLKIVKQMQNENEKMMTFEMATQITYYFLTSNKKYLQMIAENMPVYLTIEERALVMMEEWINYRNNRDSRFFVYYAALQLVIAGSNRSDLIDIISEMFDIDRKFRFISLIKCLFKSESVVLTTLRQILIILNRNERYASKIDVWIDHKDIFNLILNLELQRLISNVNESSNISAQPFLLMISGCSKDLQRYLVEHIYTFLNEQNDFKEEYIAVILKWIITTLISNRMRTDFIKQFYKCIFTLLHDQRFPHIQKTIINSINSELLHGSSEEVFLQNDTRTHFEKIIASYETYTEDVLAACLLAYGNYLLKLQKFESSRTISNEIQHSLTNLFQTSLSNTISIRAAFCLIFTEQSIKTIKTILNWFENKWILTSEKEYNILLEQSLYQWRVNPFEGNTEEIVDHIKKYSSELLDVFIMKLYNYLSNKNNRKYPPNHSFKYINITRDILNENSAAFLSSVRRSSFGEDNFKKELYHYLCYNNKREYAKAIFVIYATFGVITNELVEMLIWIDDEPIDNIWRYLIDIKRISNRDVIEKLFQQLNFTMYDTKFNLFVSILQLLVNLARVHVVSSLEVHQRISIIINQFFYDDDWRNLHQRNDICRHLLGLSCIETVSASMNNVEVFTEDDVDEDFDRIIEALERNSALFFRRDFFFTVFRSVLTV